MTDAPPAVELQDVIVSFGGTVVVRSTLSLETGTTTLVVGRSGAGKSVLWKAVAGLVEHSGTVRVRAAPLVFVHQDPALLDDMSIRENVAFPASRLGGAAVGERVDQALHLLDLRAVEDERPARLPLATQKRAALARAIALAPGVLVVDEPTTGLDVHAAATVDAALATLAAGGALTLVVITHSNRTVAALSAGPRHRRVVVDAGVARLMEAA